MLTAMSKKPGSDTVELFAAPNSQLAKYLRSWNYLQAECVEIDEKKGRTMQPVDDAVDTTTDTNGVEISQSRELNAADRCDVCGAQAYIRVSLATGELMFCSHHGNEKRSKLEPIAVAWQDETEKLLAR
jgi:hypothetical protein